MCSTVGISVAGRSSVAKPCSNLGLGRKAPVAEAGNYWQPSLWMFSTRRQHGFLAPSTNSCVPSSSTTSILLACASPSNHLRRHIGDPSMSSSDSPKVTERKVDNDGHDDDDKGGFFDKVKDFIQDVGEKIEEAVGFGKPTADVTGIHIPHVSLEKIELIVDVLIANPNPVPIPLVDIEYLIESEERKLVSGTIPDAGTIHAHGSETVKIPFLLIYDDIRSTYKEIEPGSIIPYKVRVVLHIDIPVIGRISIPLEKNGEIPVPYKPDVSIDKIKFEQFSFEESTAILHLNLDNKNAFDLGLNSMDYEVWLANVSIASAELKESTNIKKQEITTMNLPISFRPKDFGAAMWDMIRGKGTGYTIKGHIDVNTPFGHMKIPISKEGGTTRLKKGDDDDDDDKE